MACQPQLSVPGSPAHMGIKAAAIHKRAPHVHMPAKANLGSTQAGTHSSMYMCMRTSSLQPHLPGGNRPQPGKSAMVTPLARKASMVRWKYSGSG